MLACEQCFNRWSLFDYHAIHAIFKQFNHVMSVGELELNICGVSCCLFD